MSDRNHWGVDIMRAFIYEQSAITRMWTERANSQSWEIMLDVHNQRTISGDSIRLCSFARAENDRNCRDSLLRWNFRLVLAQFMKLPRKLHNGFIIYQRRYFESCKRIIMIYYKYLMVDFMTNEANINDSISLADMIDIFLKIFCFLNGNNFIQNSFKKVRRNINIPNIIPIFKNFNFE